MNSRTKRLSPHCCFGSDRETAEAVSYSRTKRIGIIGGGQLGKMMILEAKRLGLYVAIIDPDAFCCAHSISDLHIVSDFYNPEKIMQLAESVDVITYESEHINVAVLEKLEQQGHTIYPSVSSLKTIQNKYRQKKTLQDNAILVPRFEKISSWQDIKTLGEEKNFSYPIMLKTTTGGYDGKGNALINNEIEIESAFQQLGNGQIELMAEEFIRFDKEISVIACRGIDGSRVVYPVAENIHVNSILNTTIVPARVAQDVVNKALRTANQVMEVFEGVGTFCVELFTTAAGEVYVNEVAPRPHNSGHYTIEGCFADQFENHIRAIVGLPFGDTGLISPTVMVNLLGESTGEAQLEGVAEAYRDPKLRVHFYGKRESRIDRKMGHFTIVDTDVEKALERTRQLKNTIRITGLPE